MARFKQIAKGTRARHVVDLPLATGEVVNVAVRPLLEAEDDEIESGALRYAKERGVEDPKAGNPIYDRGVALYTLLLSCSDPESPDEQPVPFFSDIEEIRTGLDRDRVAWLWTAQQMWQDECSPRQMKMSGQEFMQFVLEAASSEDERPFLQKRPALLWSCMRTLANLHVSSLGLSSASSLGSEPSTSETARPLDS